MVLKRKGNRRGDGGELAIKRLQTEQALSSFLWPRASCHPAMTQGSSRKTQQMLLLWAPEAA